MPQLFSRMDDANWLTPAIAEILDQGAAPPNSPTREQTRVLQQELNSLGTPARIINVRLTPSHTLFVARPESGGVLGGRKAITPQDIRRSMARIAEQHKDWTLGFLNDVQEAEGTVGILLRTDQHQPVSLRRMLVRPTFRDNPSHLALALGLTLEEQMVIRDLGIVGHLLVVGADNPKRHFVRSLLLTLVLFNTPAELRLALLGAGCQAYNALVGLPHMLGRLLTSPEDGQRLLDGLAKEAQRRQQYFTERGADNLDTYNARLKEQGSTPLPRIALLIDSLSEETWHANRERWLPTLTLLLTNGAQVGIHLLLTHETGQLPEGLSMPTRVVMRAAANEVIDKLKDFPRPNLRFVDAFVMEGEQATPVELCIVSETETNRTVEYWRQTAAKRKQEAAPTAPEVSAQTGVTGVFRSESDAMRYIAAQQNKPADTGSYVQRGAALAAYLGWLGVGPLQDVLSLTEADARAVIGSLQAAGVLEAGDGAVLRFIRLADNPLQGGG
ncbi:MAG: hypothetical protein HXY40_06655 [Chloroflexi bacterium]|nr:hypothetical protein [Chloroflexota bacterium]